jgi:hypothetical protein
MNGIGENYGGFRELLIAYCLTYLVNFPFKF